MNAYFYIDFWALVSMLSSRCKFYICFISVASWLISVQKGNELGQAKHHGIFGCVDISATLLSIPSSLWYSYWWCAQLTAGLSTQRLGPFCLFLKHKHNYLSVFVCLLSSYRPKPAGGNSNSNDAGGADDSDLEKMKQVNFLSLTKRAEREWGRLHALTVSFLSSKLIWWTFKLRSHSAALTQTHTIKAKRTDAVCSSQ